MTTYIIRRLILAVIVLFLVSVFVFLAMRLLPGDPVLMYVSSSSVQEITEEQLDAFTAIGTVFYFGRTGLEPVTP